MTSAAALLLPEIPKEVSEGAGKGIYEALVKNSLVFVVGLLLVIVILGCTAIGLHHRRQKSRFEKEADERRLARKGDQDFVIRVMKHAMDLHSGKQNQGTSREVSGSGQAYNVQANATPTEQP